MNEAMADRTTTQLIHENTRSCGISELLNPSMSTPYRYAESRPADEPTTMPSVIREIDSPIRIRLICSGDEPLASMQASSFRLSQTVTKRTRPTPQVSITMERAYSMYRKSRRVLNSGAAIASSSLSSVTSTHPSSPAELPQASTPSATSEGSAP